MQNKIIEISGTTGFDWAAQGMAILLLLAGMIVVVGLGILLFKGIQALNVYIKTNK